MNCHKDEESKRRRQEPPLPFKNVSDVRALPAHRLECHTVQTEQRWAGQQAERANRQETPDQRPHRHLDPVFLINLPTTLQPIAEVDIVTWADPRALRIMCHPAV